MYLIGFDWRKVDSRRKMLLFVSFVNRRNLFVSSIKKKRVLILLDHGNSLNVDQLELTKAMGE